jgi:hypothetical protein
VRLPITKKKGVIQIKSINSTLPLFDYYENLRESVMQENNHQGLNNVGLTLFQDKGMLVWLHTALELLDQRPTNNFPQGDAGLGLNGSDAFIKILVSMATSR